MLACCLAQIEGPLCESGAGIIKVSNTTAVMFGSKLGQIGPKCDKI